MVIVVEVCVKMLREGMLTEKFSGILYRIHAMPARGSGGAPEAPTRSSTSEEAAIPARGNVGTVASLHDSLDPANRYAGLIGQEPAVLGGSGVTMRWKVQASRVAGAAMPFRSRAVAPAAATNTKPDAPDWVCPSRERSGGLCRRFRQSSPRRRGSPVTLSREHDDESEELSCGQSLPASRGPRRAVSALGVRDRGR